MEKKFCTLYRTPVVPSLQLSGVASHLELLFTWVLWGVSKGHVCNWHEPAYFMYPGWSALGTDPAICLQVCEDCLCLLSRDGFYFLQLDDRLELGRTFLFLSCFCCRDNAYYKISLYATFIFGFHRGCKFLHLDHLGQNAADIAEWGRQPFRPSPEKGVSCSSCAELISKAALGFWESQWFLG